MKSQYLNFNKQATILLKLKYYNVREENISVR